MTPPSSTVSDGSLHARPHATLMALAPGSRFGAYEILSPLGAGGMGEVYRARDARLQRDVAIKVLHESLTLDADRVNRFEREARKLRRWECFRGEQPAGAARSLPSRDALDSPATARIVRTRRSEEPSACIAETS